MFFRLATLLLLMVTAMSLTAQTPEEAQAKALVLQSYALARNAPPEARADLLGKQAMVADKVDEQLARQWSEELWATSQGLPDGQRFIAQHAAVLSMTQADPLRAYTMTRAMTLPKRFVVSGGYDMGMSDIVNALWKKQGEAALPTVQTILRELSGTGDYPYFALGNLIAQLQKSNPGVAKVLFEDAVGSYMRAPEKPPNFDQFIEITWRALPPDAVRPVLNSVVDSLLANDAPGPDFYGRFILRDRSVIDFRTPTTANLLNLVPVMKALDLELLQRVLASRPELSVVARGESYGMQAYSGPGAGPERLDERQNPDMMMDPEKAIAAARAHQDVWKRALALAEVARHFSWGNPDRMLDALKEADALVPQIDNEQAKISVLASIAQSAQSMGDVQLARSATERGLALVSASYKHVVSATGGCPDQSAMNAQFAFDRFTETAGAVDVNFAVAHLSDYKDPLIQARLLANAAAGMLQAADQRRSKVETKKVREQWKASPASHE